MILVLVLDHVEAFDRAVASARRHHRNLALERHERFENLRLSAELVEHRRIGAIADHDLALAVVAEAAGLQHGRLADSGERGDQPVGRIDAREFGGSDAEAFDEFFLGEPVLRDGQHLRVGQHRLARREKRRGLGGDVLEFVGDDVDIRREAIERRHVEVVGLGHAAHHIEGGRMRVRAEHMAAEAEPRGRQHQHAAELSAAQNADGRVRPERPALRVHLSSGASATASVCCLRQASSRFASAASVNASTLAASSAALIAPDLPIASVPTGTPGGICTME